MKYFILINIYLTCLLILGCSINKSNNSTATNKELVFQTGFEGSSRIVTFEEAKTNSITPNYINQTIIGLDSTLSEKSDWVNDLSENSKSGIFIIEYTGGDSTKRYAKIIPEPDNEKNHVLHFWLNDYWLASENEEKARIQADIYDIPRGYKELYQSVRVFLHKDWNILKKYPDKINWLTISEFWNNEWWVENEKYGFRVTLGIGKTSKDECDLSFILAADDSDERDIWTKKNTEIKVPIGKWFTMDYYFKEGNHETGRFMMSITPEGEPTKIVFDITGYTHNTKDPSPNGITGYNPMKLYTSKEIISFMKSNNKTLQIYWDDLKVWKGKISK